MPTKITVRMHARQRATCKQQPISSDPVQRQTARILDHAGQQLLRRRCNRYSHRPCVNLHGIYVLLCEAVEERGVEEDKEYIGEVSHVNNERLEEVRIKG